MTVDRAQIATRLARVRARTFELFEPLDAAGLRRAPSPIMSPPIWDLGHIAAYEELWVACALGGYESLHPDLQHTYDAFETPRAARTSVRLLDEVECRDYLGRVRDRTLETLAGIDLDPDGPPLSAAGFAFDLIAQHEAQHTETVLQALQMYEDGSYRPPGRRPLPAADLVDRNDRVEIPEHTFLMGACGERFAYDCELPAHVRSVGAFAIDRFPVSNGRYLAFVDDGGYARPECWSEAGWRWREEHDVDAPLYWRRDGVNWCERSFDTTTALDHDRPVCHVSYWEAEAFANWAGGRLPTEAEWECAAGGASTPFPWGDADPDGRANVDQLAFACAPVGAFAAGASPVGCMQMIGDVWEWTSTPFDAYPGFAAFPYREYAEVFFGDRYRVLRGGSWATQPVAVRTSFRNWDLPQRRQIFSGIRLAWDVA